jgi:hypothetical protein
LAQPRRLVDTQPGSGYQGAGQALTGLSSPRCFDVGGEVGVPSDAAGVLANLTVVGHGTDGWLTVFPYGSVIPDTSNLNFDTDQYAIANLASVPLGTDGRLCAVAQPGTHLIIDVVGHFVTSSNNATKLLPQPKRIVDTQPGSTYQGEGQPLLGLAHPLCYQVGGLAGVPADATGVLANLTVVGHSTDGWLTVFPYGNAIPDTSSLNFDTAEYAIANMAVSPLGADGQLCAVAQPSTHLIIDVFGYVRGPTIALRFDGEDDYVEVPDSSDFSVPTTGGLTIAVWMRPDAITFPKTEGSGYVHWLGKGTRQNQEWTFRMYSQPNAENRANRISFYVFNREGDRGIGSYFQDPVTPGEWIHAVAVVDDQRTYIYKNGSFRQCDQYCGPSDGTCQGYNPNEWIMPEDTSSPLRWGARTLPSEARSHSFFKGALRDVQLWNRPLTSQEIAALYTSDTVPQLGLVAEYRLGEGQGEIAHDSTGKHDAKVTGASWITVP